MQFYKLKLHACSSHLIQITHHHAGLRLANSSKSALVATPKTNLLLSSVNNGKFLLPIDSILTPIKEQLELL